MTDQMKISIIVPVYNVERYIEECLKSVMEQNFGGGLGVHCRGRLRK